MKSWYQQFEFQTLIDLLAEETEKYTRCFTSGKITEATDHKAAIDALVEEIKRRKSGESIAPTKWLQGLPGDFREPSV
jgi:hypothetical protein